VSQHVASSGHPTKLLVIDQNGGLSLEQVPSFSPREKIPQVDDMLPDHLLAHDVVLNSVKKTDGLQDMVPVTLLPPHANGMVYDQVPGDVSIHCTEFDLPPHMLF